MSAIQTAILVSARRRFFGLEEGGVGADLKLGLTTAPVLYAWEEHEAMGPLIQRKFEQDVELVGSMS